MAGDEKDWTDGLGRPLTLIVVKAMIGGDWHPVCFLASRMAATLDPKIARKGSTAPTMQVTRCCSLSFSSQSGRRGTWHALAHGERYLEWDMSTDG